MNEPVKANFAYLVIFGCCYLQSISLVKFCTSCWKYSSSSFSGRLFSNVVMYCFVLCGHFPILKIVLNHRKLSLGNRMDKEILNLSKWIEFEFYNPFFPTGSIHTYYHHHHDVLLAWISLTLFCYLFLSSIASTRSSR